MATADPPDIPSRAKRSSPAASTTASRSARRASMREVVDVPVGHPEAALVVADDRRDLAEVVEEVAPDRALPVVLEVAEPARRDDERRPRSVDGVGEPRPVSRSAEADLLVGAARRRSGPHGGDHLGGMVRLGERAVGLAAGRYAARAGGSAGAR